MFRLMQTNLICTKRFFLLSSLGSQSRSEATSLKEALPRCFGSGIVESEIWKEGMNSGATIPSQNKKYEKKKKKANKERERKEE